MTEPIVEQIAAGLKTTLEDVTKANGYETDVTSVVRPTKDGGYSPADGMIVLLQDDPEEAEDLDAGPGGLKSWIQPFLMLCFVRPSDTEEAPVDTAINRFRSDVEKALRADPTRGGLAIDTRIRAPIGFETPDGAYEGVVVQADIDYRTLENDPYSQGG